MTDPTTTPRPARGLPLRGLWRLTWLEIKIFLREPMGAIGTIGFPVFAFVVFSRALSRRAERPPRLERLLQTDLPIFIVILLALSSVLSLIAIISIYREGGILKRLKATPLSPITILTSHVIVKLLLAVVTMGLLSLAGRRYYSDRIDASWPSLVLALVLVLISILSIGFVIASVVPTARFAQPLGSILLYPQLVISGLFFPIDALPGGWQVIAKALPVSHAVALLRGIWTGGTWLDQGVHVVGLVATLVVCTVAASRIFRWE